MFRGVQQFGFLCLTQDGVPFSGSGVFPLCGRISGQRSIQVLVSVNSPVTGLRSSIIVPNFASPLTDVDRLSSLVFKCFFHVSRGPGESSVGSSFLEVKSCFGSALA